MNIRTFAILWRGQLNWTLFENAYVRRKIGRRFLRVPYGPCEMIDNLATWEIGQLLGGN